MQTYFSDMLARERIAEFRREAARDLLAAPLREARRARRRRARAAARVLVEHQPGRATA
ncbi:MAG TPA: hypothetical protein VGM21_18420 [Actinomycetota bacterium]|jgi:hypothetical protein